MTTILVVLLIVAFGLASEALRERRHDRHGVERRMVTYAGQHDSRVSYRLDAIRRSSRLVLADRNAAPEPAIGRRMTSRIGTAVRA